MVLVFVVLETFRRWGRKEGEDDDLHHQQMACSHWRPQLGYRAAVQFAPFAFDSVISRAYGVIGPATGLAALQKIIQEFSEKVYQPGYKNFTTLVWTFASTTPILTVDFPCRSMPVTLTDGAELL